MSKILLENPGFASPQSHSTLSRVLRDRAIQAARAFQAQVRRFELGLEEPEPEDEYGFLDGAYYITTREEQAADEARREREEAAMGSDIQRGCEIMRARAAARRARPPSPARRIRAQARVRARRSPASVRRATTDSGGGDSDGGDPEPRPRHLLYSLPAHYDGGAL
jgi:hypothetical protein